MKVLLETCFLNYLCSEGKSRRGGAIFIAGSPFFGFGTVELSGFGAEALFLEVERASGYISLNCCGILLF